MGLGLDARPRRRPRQARALGPSRTGARCSARSAAGSGSARCSTMPSTLHEYEDGVPFTAAGFEVTAHRVLHYQLLAFGFRASANGTTVGYSGDSGPSDGLAEIARYGRPVPLRSDAARSEPRRRHARPSRGRGGDRRLRGRAARSGSCSRTARSSGRSRIRSSSPTTGSRSRFRRRARLRAGRNRRRPARHPVVDEPRVRRAVRPADEPQLEGDRPRADALLPGQADLDQDLLGGGVIEEVLDALGVDARIRDDRKVGALRPRGRRVVAPQGRADDSPRVPPGSCGRPRCR